MDEIERVLRMRTQWTLDGAWTRQAYGRDARDGETQEAYELRKARERKEDTPT